LWYNLGSAFCTPVPARPVSETLRVFLYPCRTLPPTLCGSSMKLPYFIAYALHHMKLHALSPPQPSPFSIDGCLQVLTAQSPDSDIVQFKYKTPLFHLVCTLSHEASCLCHLCSPRPSPLMDVHRLSQPKAQSTRQYCVVQVQNSLISSHILHNSNNDLLKRAIAGAWHT
jgi:hypothetical protein